MRETDRSGRKPGQLDVAVNEREAPGTEGCKVLVVEDNLELAQNLGRLVRILGHEPRIALSGPDGLEEVLRCRPDVLLCDIGLPGMDGNDLARAIRADSSLAHIRLIAMSGGDLDQDRDQILAAGFDYFLPKPLTFDHLRQVLHDAIHGVGRH
ncbi:response regulator [Isosphaeraceae bacterium EP7]